ncbi:hypothetical protein HMPREF1320_1657 [Capnocytophaga sp. oral taxon 335 str. F0486]|nr:hypothetical protein HMPREF1320_1657 [Capnocytophaga sp. oral taxon 335 str. F0486]
MFRICKISHLNLHFIPVKYNVVERKNLLDKTAAPNKN